MYHTQASFNHSFMSLPYTVPAPNNTPSMTETENHFTVFIRLPFARGDFIDPPPVVWSAAKERELWDELSKSSKEQEIDWTRLAERLDVTQAFLLQQAAWLYERQLSQVRAQMKKIPKATGRVPPGLGSGAAVTGSVGSQAMRRTESGGSRAPSRLTLTSTSSAAAAAAAAGRSSQSSVPVTPTGISAVSRTSTSTPLRATSTTTAVRPRADSGASIEPVASSRRNSRDHEVLSHAQSRRGSIQHPTQRSPRSTQLTPIPTHHASSSEDDTRMTQSRLVHRRPNPAATRRPNPAAKLQQQQQQQIKVHSPMTHGAEHKDDDEDEEDAFLPFSHTSPDAVPKMQVHGGTPPLPLLPQTQTQMQMQMQTRRHEPFGPASRPERPPSPPKKPDPRSTPPTPLLDHRPLSSHRKLTLAAPEKSSSPAPPPASTTTTTRLAQPRIPLIGKHDSDTSPSIGSSFSDLEDASITQSALEEALLSGMGNTTMTVNANTTGTSAGTGAGVVGRVLRSRYFEARGGEGG